MARLPNPGGNANNWGTQLNDFLHVSHNEDGTLRPSLSLQRTKFWAKGDRQTDDRVAIQTTLDAASQ